LEDTAVNERIILKLILNRLGMWMWPGSGYGAVMALVNTVINLLVP
jgi:hypothetical protein